MKSKPLCKHSFAFVVALLSIWLGAISAQGQTTSFTYQGRLTDGGTAANGNYDLQFALWDSLSSGNQVGSTQTLNTVAVGNGVFTVSLDFGANAFPGANRFLEISARPSGGGSFTLLSPRQPITSTPYAVRSLNAASADSVPASGVPAGSGNYIQNSSSAQIANFNISGNGTVAGTLMGHTINATTQFNLNGSRILSKPGNCGNFGSLFVGLFAGNDSLSGCSNSFFGNFSGQSITSGDGNSYFGDAAGNTTTTGSNNSFFGDGAGGNTQTGDSNSFFGHAAGARNSSGQFNVSVGAEAGFNATGNSNTFVGAHADFPFAPDFSPSGNRNTLLGADTALASGGMFSPNNATAIGANARVDQSNSLVLGSINGVNGANADTKVGIGTTAPTKKFHLKGPGSDGSGNGDLLITGTGTVGAAITFESTGTGGRRYSWISTANSADPGGGKLAAFDVTAGAYRMVIDSAGNVGIGTTSPTATLSVNGTANKPGGGSWAVFSDERLKNIKGRFTPGLRAVMQLQPLRYEYKRDNALDIKSEGDQVGFSAQAIQKIIPEAVTATDQGYLLINNDPILWTMLNAIKEQQAQIEKQSDLIRQQEALALRQQQQLNALRKLACRSHPRARVCQ